MSRPFTPAGRDEHPTRDLPLPQPFWGRGPGGGGRPRILFLTQVLPYPLDAGPKVRAYHVLCRLAGQADVTLASFVRADDPPEAIDHLRAVCAAVHVVPMRRSRLRDAARLAQSLLAGTSFIIARDSVPAMHRLLADLARRHDYAAVHADQLWMAQYARALPIAHKVLDDHNAVFRIFQRLAAGEPSVWRRWLWRREARHIARYEAEQLDAFDHVLFVTEEDRSALAAAATAAQRARLGAHSSVVPICVDASAIAPIAVRPDARRITLLGTMFWPPNVEGALWFAEHVFPQVLAQAPGAVLTIVGKQPPASIARLGDTFGASVDIAGYVPDVRPYLEQTAAFVVPLLSGGGMRVKILDAWAWGLPVVSTTIGAEGIDIRPGEDIAIADTPPAFAAAVAALLADPGRRAALGAAGRRAVEARYDAARVYGALASVYPMLVTETL